MAKRTGRSVFSFDASGKSGESFTPSSSETRALRSPRARYLIQSQFVWSIEKAGFLKSVFTNMAEVSIDGAVHFICMDWRHLAEVMGAAQGIYSELKNLCVWNKNNGGMGSFYRSKHELVFVYKVGTDSHVNTVELGAHGRYRTNVWDYAGVNTWRAGRDADLQMHPTVKPTALVIDAIKDCSRRGDIVLDAFSGFRYDHYRRAEVPAQGKGA